MSQNSAVYLHTQMQIRSRNHDVYEKAVCNIVGTFATDTRCWNFVSKLFRSRIYEVSACQNVAEFTTGCDKIQPLSARATGPEMKG